MDKISNISIGPTLLCCVQFHINGLVQDHSNSSANIDGLVQDCSSANGITAVLH